MYIHEKKKYEIWGYVITLWTNKTYVIKKKDSRIIKNAYIHNRHYWKAKLSSKKKKKIIARIKHFAL